MLEGKGKPGNTEKTKITPWTAEVGAELEALIDEPGFCKRLAASKDRAEFKQIVHDVVKRLGFTDYGLLRIKQVDDMGGWLFTLPRELLQEYHRHAYYDQEIVWQALVYQDCPVQCSTAYEYAGRSPIAVSSSTNSTRVYELMKRFGYDDAFCKSLTAYDGKQRLVFLVLAKGMPVEEFKEKAEACDATLSLLGQVVDYVGQTHFPEFFAGSRATRAIAMTPMSIKVLRTVDQYYQMFNQPLIRSIKNTARELYIGNKTVVRHLEAVKREVNAKTFTEAVERAKQMNMYDDENMRH